MTRTTTTPRRRAIRALQAALLTLLALDLSVSGALSASAASYTSITGEGSSWAGAAWADWVAQAANQGVAVNYTPNGSSVGRKDFAQQNNATFADSEIPFTGEASDPQDRTSPSFKWGMMPVVAGGTAFMYNLPVGGSRFTKLRLSMSDIAGIFSGRISQWNDAALRASNPGVALPAHQIIVVVRSDGSGATAQFKLWMLRQYPADYKLLTSHTGGDPAHASSYYPTGDYGQCKSSSGPCFTAQNGSNGVTTFTKNTQYTIDYDEYAYALGAGYPVAQVKNAAGYYTLPTAQAVAVALIKAKINTNPADPNYLSQDLSAVYSYGDPRSYPMSMYSYEIIPKQTNAVTSRARGATLAWLSTNAVCEWQRDMGPLGYSPLPMNLVLASLDQIKQIPGIDAKTASKIAATEKGVLQSGGDPCNNPTFKAGDDPAHNVLVDTAPFPAGCSAACQAPWKLAGAGVAASGPHQTQQSGGAAGTASDAPSTTGDGTAAGGGAQTCDADTGVCTTSDGGLASGSNVKAVPVVAATDAGWAGPLALGILAIFLLVMLIIVPPVVMRAVRGPGRGGGS
jgi:phosphate transport system substrate-binding protein